MTGGKAHISQELLRRAVHPDLALHSSDFDLNPDVWKLLPPDRALRPAAVLVPVIERAAGMQLLLTKRSPTLKHHPGQIAFPGGKVDAADAGPLSAALREAEEEIGLPRAEVEVVGALDPHETITGFAVSPFLGMVSESFRPSADPGEVEEVFEVPLDFVTDPANFQIQGRIWQRQMRHYYAVPYGPYYIWGATARMLRALAERVARCG